jgi:predicted DNA-binding transcriptional regulator AlpA
MNTIDLSDFGKLPDEALIDAKGIAVLFCCSVNTIWRRTKEGKLPAPIKISDQQTRWRVGGIRKALAEISNSEAA